MRKLITSLLFLCIACTLQAEIVRVYCRMTYSWWTTGDAAIAAYTFAEGVEGITNAAWPGERMTRVDGEDGLWYIDLENYYSHIIFSRVSGSGTLEEWGAQTENLIFPVDEFRLFEITSSTETWSSSGMYVQGAWTQYNGTEADLSGAGGADFLFNTSISSWEESKTYTSAQTFIPPTIGSSVELTISYAKVVPSQTPSGISDAPMGYIQPTRNSGSNLCVIQTNILPNVDNVTFTQAATQSNSGWGLRYSEDAGSTWITLYDNPCNPGQVETSSVYVGKSNVMLQWYPLSTSSSTIAAYIFDITVYAANTDPYTPTPTGSYYLVGSFCDWITENAIPFNEVNEIDISLPAGTHMFKVLTQYGSWDGALGVESLRTDCSSSNVISDQDGNVVVTITDSANTINVKVVDGQLCVTGDFDVTDNLIHLYTGYTPDEAAAYVYPPSGTYERGSDVTLEANISVGGWMFDHWQDDLSWDNPRSVHLSKDTTIMAVFSPGEYGILINRGYLVRGAYTGRVPEGSYIGQFFASVNLEQGDRIQAINTFHDSNYSWGPELEEGGLSENFSRDEGMDALMCNVAGCYDIYLKIHYGQSSDYVYIGGGTNCSNGEPYGDGGAITDYTYSLVGDKDLFGTTWDIYNSNTIMVQEGDNHWTHAINSVYLNAYQLYEYKVVTNQSWDVALYPTDGGNYSFYVTQSGSYALTFDFNVTSGATVTTALIEADTYADRFKDYSNYAVLTNSDSITPLSYAGIGDTGIPEYLAVVRMSPGDYLEILDRGANHDSIMYVTLEEYGLSNYFTANGDNKRLTYSGAYQMPLNIYYKTNQNLFISEGYTSPYLPALPYTGAKMAQCTMTISTRGNTSATYPYSHYHSISINGNTLSNYQTAQTLLGSTVTIEARPDEGYHFLKWSDENYANPRQLVMTQDTTLEAVFGSFEEYPVGILLNRKKFVRSTFNDGEQLIVRANIQEGDTIELYFTNDNIFFMAELEHYGEYEKFSGSVEQGYLICQESGCYDIYFKLEEGITQTIYIGAGTQCFDGVDWTPPVTNIYAYSLVGDSALFGQAWDLESVHTDMIRQEDSTTYTYLLDSVVLYANNIYQYKVIANHVWNVKEYPSVQEGDNYTLSVEQSGVYSILFTLDTNTGCTATPTYLHAIHEEQPTSAQKAWYITPSSPYEMDNLRLALAEASAGDTIIMAAGAYVESNSNYIVFAGKDVTVKAAEGAEVIIQPQVPITIGNGGYATFENVKIDASRLQDLGAYEHLIYVTDDMPNRLSIRGCEIYGYGINSSMIYCSSANKFAEIRIEDCYFHDIMKSILFTENTTAELTAQIKNSTFANILTNTESYWVGVIDIRSTEATLNVSNCTFYNVIPMSTDYSAISKITLAKGSVSNCIFMLPTAQEGVRAMRGVTATNCITYNYLSDSGTGIHSSVTTNNCIQIDPLFMDAANGDFTLGEGSPALTLNAGEPIGDPRWSTNVELPTTDFATPYVFTGAEAILSGRVSLNEENHMAWSNNTDATQNGIATWKVNVTQPCSVSVTLNLTESGSGHRYQVAVLNGDESIISEPLAEPADSWVTTDLLLDGRIDIPEAGTYIIRLTNLTEWSENIIRSITMVALNGQPCESKSGTCGAQGDNVRWVLSCDSVLTISGTGAMVDSYYGTTPPWTEYGSKIRDIVIEEGVTTTAAYAFYNVGNTAGVYNNVRTLYIPSTMEYLVNNYFYQCPLVTVTINSDTIVGKGGYTSNSNISQIFGGTIRQFIIGDSVKSIGNSAFYNQSPDSLESVILPEGLESIGTWAFGYAENLKHIVLPSTLRTLDTEAFRHSGLESIEIPSGLETIGSSVFNSCENLSSVTFHNGLKTIGVSAFQNCTSIRQITIPRTVETLSSGAFEGCSGLTQVTIMSPTLCGEDKSSSSLTKLSLGGYVQDLIIGDSITRLGNYAFSGLDSLRSVLLPGSMEVIGEYAFSNCKSLRSLTLPDAVTTIGNYAFNSCSALDTIEFSTSLTNIGQCAFYQCTSLHSIALPENLRVINRSAFYGCTGLTGVVIPSSVDSLGSNIFNGCLNLTKATIHSNTLCSSTYTTTANIKTLLGSDSIKTYIIGEGVTGIGNYAFYNSKMEALYLPSTLTNIGTGSFGNCNTLTRVTSEALTPPTIASNTTFSKQDTLFVPCESKTLYKQAQYWQNFHPIICSDDTLFGAAPIEITYKLREDWMFIMLPSIFGFSADGLLTEGDIIWATYNGSNRAMGSSGWEIHDATGAFNSTQAYIVRARTDSATLTIQIPDQAREKAGAALPLNYHAAAHEQNANWNFLGNPYPYAFDIMSALDTQGISSPITIWNGTGYSMYMPGLDEYILQPFETFFIQMPDGGATGIQFAPEYIME